jgi:3-phosphoshikimate 1-carboxyvinyltransferase
MLQPIIIRVPGSKSVSNRALLLAALASGKTRLKGLLMSDDTEACIEALRALGVSVKRVEADVYDIVGVKQFRSARLDCRDAGTVTRFLLPIAAALGGTFEFHASARMSERPLRPLLEVLQAQGVHFEFLGAPMRLPLRMTSQGLAGGAVSVDILDSSQFVSGLLLAAPFAKTPLQVHAQGLSSRPYVRMTLAMMRDFGIETQVLNDTVYVRAGHYQPQKTYTIEADASTASYFFAAALLLNLSVKVPHLNVDTLQGDIRFLTILEKMGAQVTSTPEGVIVTGQGEIKGVGEVDFTGMSDTFMTLAALAPFANSPTHIHGLAHTRLQESDRLEAMRQGLSALGAKVSTTQDSILIHPSRLHAGVVDSHRDHRIAMSHAVIGLKVPGVEILQPECVKKTCPQFFELLASLGDGVGSS